MCAVQYAYNISVCKQVYPILTQVLPLCMRSWPIPITSTVKVGFLQTSQASTAPKTPRIITYYDNNKYIMFVFPHWEWLGCSQRNGQHSLFWCFSRSCSSLNACSNHWQKPTNIASLWNTDIYCIYFTASIDLELFGDGQGSTLFWNI